MRSRYYERLDDKRNMKNMACSTDSKGEKGSYSESEINCKRKEGVVRLFCSVINQKSDST